MKRTVAMGFCAAVLAGLACRVATTAPKPSDVPVSWELEFAYKQPRPIQVTLPGQDDPTTFWYMEYTVTNRTEDEQVFVPDLVLYTDTGQILRDGRGVPSLVFRKIKESVSEPLLKDQAGVSGRLLRGSNNAKDGVMIFQDIDPKAGAFDIFVGGLSGETAIVKPPHPVPVTVIGEDKKRKTVMKDEIVLSRTLQLHYKLPGEAAARFQTQPRLVRRTWVMR